MIYLINYDYVNMQFIYVNINMPLQSCKVANIEFSHVDITMLTEIFMQNYANIDLDYLILDLSKNDKQVYIEIVCKKKCKTFKFKANHPKMLI